MALVTRPVLSLPHAARPKIAQKTTVIVEEKCLNAHMYNKEFSAVLLDIHAKGGTISANHCGKIEKVSNSITSEKESKTVLRTLCALSFLDRYQDTPIINNVFCKLNGLITKPQWTMFHQLEEECSELLTRMGTIENLRSLDTDLICLLCTLCHWKSANLTITDLLFEVGRSVWPYMNRSLWNSEPFVDFVCDILEVVGSRLEQSHPKNFKTAWKVIHKNVIGVSTTAYSRLRLLSVVEHKNRMWSLPEEVRGFYNQLYKEFVETKKKEIFSFLGLLPSRRKTSLSAKPGRSAADFLKRKLSSDGQEMDASSSNCDGHLNEVYEDVFEDNESSCTADIQDSSSNIKTDSKTLLKQDISCYNKSDSDSYVKEDSSSDENCSVVQSSQPLIKQSSNLNNSCSSVQSLQEPQNEAVSNNEAVTVEETSSQESTQDDTTSSETSNNMSPDTDHRSMFLERKKIIVKVPKKYVGRVIGARGTVIISIQNETGATVHFLRGKGPAAFNEEESTEVVDQLDEMEQEKEFEITGTDDAIRKAQQKIQNLVATLNNMENRTPVYRSFSEEYPRQGFKQIYRSLSCPIADWGHGSCSGDCASCEKGHYCRAFLLSQSESPSAWVRPNELSVTGDADWTEFVVKTQVSMMASSWRLDRNTAKSCSDVLVSSENGDMNLNE